MQVEQEEASSGRSTPTWLDMDHPPLPNETVGKPLEGAPNIALAHGGVQTLVDEEGDAESTFGGAMHKEGHSSVRQTTF